MPRSERCSRDKAYYGAVRRSTTTRRAVLASCARCNCKRLLLLSRTSSRDPPAHLDDESISSAHDLGTCGCLRWDAVSSLSSRGLPGPSHLPTGVHDLGRSTTSAGWLLKSRGVAARGDRGRIGGERYVRSRGQPRDESRRSKLRQPG